MEHMLSVPFLLACMSACVSSHWHDHRHHEAIPSPPPWKAKAEMARYVAHYTDWGVVSAISPEFGFRPYGTLQSFSDGTMANSSGTPYFYISSMSDTYKNIAYNASATLTLSLAQTDYCVKNELDPEEPTCSRLTLLGEILAVKTEDEQSFAKDALFTRHPAMKDWPSGHGWQFYKLELSAAILLDYYGGASHIDLKDYYAAKP